MPKRKRSVGKGRRVKRRKPSYKRRPGRRWRVPRGIRSQKRVVKLRWVQYDSLNPGVDQFDFKAICANGAAHPDPASTHQPRYMDELEKLYNHYCVLGSKITVKVIPTFSTGGIGVAGVFLSDDTTFSTKVRDMVEQNRSKWRLISPTYYVKPYTITKTFSAKKFYNIVDAKDNVTRLGAAMGATPTEKAQFIVWAGAADPTEDQAAYNVYIIVDYIVMLSEPKEIGASATTT